MDHHPGQSLQALRIRLGHKAKDIAPQLGISPSYYSEIERGKKPLPSDPRFFLALCAAFGVADFLFVSGTESSKITKRPLTKEEKGSIGDFIEREGPELFLRRLLSRVEKTGPPVLAPPHDSPAVSGKEEMAPSESESEFNDRLNDFERVARHFFDDVSEIARLAHLIKPSGQSADLLLLQGTAKSVQGIQPWVEKGFSRLLKENRAARRLVKSKISKPKR